MPNELFNTGAGELWGAGTPIALLTDDVKLALLNTGYTFSADHDVMTDGPGGATPGDAEAGGTGYAGGYGGAGRRSLASKTITVDKANNRSAFDAADITWEGIDVGELVAALAILEDHLGSAGNDGQTRILGHYDTNFPVTTNGGDLTVQSPNDLIRLNRTTA